ncbi:MAG TPA: DUF4364 family protein [Lachnospiraceae bacterium]
MTDSLTLYKLMILYMLDKVNFPMTNNQLCSFITEGNYTDYFHVQQSLNELVESNLIQMDTIRNMSQFRLTKDGSDTLSYFGNDISQEIRDEMDTYLYENSYELRNESNITADYYLTPQMDYAIQCRIREGQENLMELTLTVPTEEIARHACLKWKKEHQDIYENIIKKLL